MNKQDLINKIRKLVKEQGCKLLEVHWIDLDKKQCIITAQPPKLTEPFKPTAYMVFPKYGVDLLAPSYGAYAYGFQEIKLEDAVLHELVIYGVASTDIVFIAILKNINTIDWNYLTQEATRYGPTINNIINELRKLIVQGKEYDMKTLPIGLDTIAKAEELYNVEVPEEIKKIVQEVENKWRALDQ
ncbi:MAG: hypothetical protein DRJ40_01485 [Thermoprotei archaeon]|nr:MAG: hypothetical protein DRJ40_01485 [Thermoprotei archaeon]